jgi:aspartate kinase
LLKIRVFKFGGAAIKDASAFLNVLQIVRQASQEAGRLIIVVSAMGKTTNALEAIVAAARRGQEYESLIEELLEKHIGTAEAILEDADSAVDQLQIARTELSLKAKQLADLPFDEGYDQLVSLGEVMSSRLLFSLLHQNLPDVELLDARELISTDAIFRAAQVDSVETEGRIKAALAASDARLFVVGGFIGSEPQGRTTTLGREGSDYTAALFGSALRASSVTFWKDVPGVLNADPVRMPSATLIPAMTYAEAAEMTYYGASVIHPKTLKPLAAFSVPLLVKSFKDPARVGTYIGPDNLPSAFGNVMLVRESVALITCATKHIEFVSEKHITRVLSSANEAGLQVLMIENSALAMQLIVPQDFERADIFAKLLEQSYDIDAQFDLLLTTFLRADAQFIVDNQPLGRSLLEQRTPHWYRILSRA